MRREALVVVIVTLEDDVGLRAREEVPERRVRDVRAVGAGAEPRVVPVGEGAAIRGVRRDRPGASATVATPARSHRPWRSSSSARSRARRRGQ